MAYPRPTQQLGVMVTPPPAPPPPPPPPPPPTTLVVAVSPAEQNTYNIPQASSYSETFFWGAVIVQGVGPFTYAWSTGSHSSSTSNVGNKPAGQPASGGSVTVNVFDAGLGENASADGNWAITFGGPPP